MLLIFEKSMINLLTDWWKREQCWQVKKLFETLFFGGFYWSYVFSLSKVSQEKSRCCVCWFSEFFSAYLKDNGPIQESILQNFEFFSTCFAIGVGWCMYKLRITANITP